MALAAWWGMLEEIRPVMATFEALGSGLFGDAVPEAASRCRVMILAVSDLFGR